MDEEHCTCHQQGDTGELIDEAVLRKHAQMLSDAGIDVVIFDVTNQITYREDYWRCCASGGNRGRAPGP
jgi:hypothetical protein